MRIRLNPLVVGLGLALLSVACGDTAPLEPDTAPAGEVAVTESALTYRYCTDGSVDCDSGCTCTANQCVPNGFGPTHPDCGAPPRRECSTGADCRSSCICSAGYCAPNGFSPPSPYCHLPPPDAYEDNNAATQFTAYPGYPLTGFNFHQLGDLDWLAVYFSSAMTATFETYNVQNGANTYLEVFTNPNAAPIIAHDDVCTVWYNPACLASRVTLNVPANSVYYIRVSNLNYTAHNVYQQSAPTYDFRIY